MKELTVVTTDPVLHKAIGSTFHALTGYSTKHKNEDMLAVGTCDTDKFSISALRFIAEKMTELSGSAAMFFERERK